MMRLLIDHNKLVKSLKHGLKVSTLMAWCQVNRIGFWLRWRKNVFK